MRLRHVSIGESKMSLHELFYLRHGDVPKVARWVVRREAKIQLMSAVDAGRVQIVVMAGGARCGMEVMHESDLSGDSIAQEQMNGGLGRKAFHRRSRASLNGPN